MKQILKNSIIAIFILTSTHFYSQNKGTKETTQKKDSIETPTNNLDEVVIVGSRNPKKSKLETAVPVDVINLAKIRNLTPQTSTNDILTYLIPSFNSNRQSKRYTFII